MYNNQTFRFKPVFVISFLFVISTVSYAQVSDTGNEQSPLSTNASKKDTQQNSSATQKPGDEKKASTAITLPARVLQVYNPKYLDTSSERNNMASIGDIIVVRASNLDSLINRSQCKDVSGNPLSGCQPQKICLFINGRPIVNIFPLSGAPQKIGNTKIWELQYQLDRNQDNDKTWATLLGSPPLFNNRFFVEPVTISIGLQNEYAVETANNFNENNFKFERIHRGWFWACFAGIIVYIGLLIYFIRKKGLLRDRSIDLSSIGISQNGNPPYSLARFQMAFWFSLVILSFLFIWLITDAYNIITPTVLALIGISAGTSLSAMVIDNSKKQDMLNKTINLQQQLNDPAITAAQLLQINTEITLNKRELASPASSGIFSDILEDVNGVSFHRLQMLVWTMVLGLIFIYSVWKRLSMPDFDATLLALQGLTAGTYLGFKFPEKQT